MEVPEKDVDASMRFVKENEMVMFDYREDGTFSIETPTYVILMIIKCSYKYMENDKKEVKILTLENGESVQVHRDFKGKEGDSIWIMTCGGLVASKDVYRMWSDMRYMWSLSNFAYNT